MHKFFSTLLLLFWSILGNAQSASGAESLDWAKKKCSDLGFKVGTERYGNCVLQISRDSEVNYEGADKSGSNTRASENFSKPTAVKTIRDCDVCPEMVSIPAGTFFMGSKPDPFASIEPQANEHPQHKVTINSFFLGKFEVTQEQWFHIMGDLPSKFKGRILPVDSISWNDAQEFVKRLSLKTQKKYRLPTEAEWEYAARAGSQTIFHFGDDEKELSRYAWFDTNSEIKTHPVGQKNSNRWGLHDMYGNVFEWTQDCWNENYLGAPSDGSSWSEGTCSMKVLRGGSYRWSSNDNRSAYRYRDSSDDRFYTRGLRVARDN
jgi:formylglycine-generating enzyme required for sulfatase activity